MNTGCQIFNKTKYYSEKSIVCVAEPPGPPRISWGSQEVVGVVGPLEEHQHLHLACSARGGRPPPSLSWWRGGSEVPSTVSVSFF